VPRLIRLALEKAGVQGPDRVSTGVDVVGDIAIIRLERFSQREKRRIGEALLAGLSNVRGVYEQVGGIEGELRLRKVKRLAGFKNTLTVHRENGCQFRVDVARCFFSPRLSTERLRVASSVRRGEKVLNMFAGVGPFSIPIAKSAGARVTSCEINTFACKLHEENDRLNKVESFVDVLNEDADTLPNALKSKYDRVIMPHPSQADKFLPAAMKLAKRRAVIHYYRHVLGRTQAEAAENLAEELSELVPRGTGMSIRRVREVGPRWSEMVADLKLKP
jgi:tRNA (guanine37-N1)-methyltransferase